MKKHSPEFEALLTKAVEVTEAREKHLASLTPEQREAWIEEWAKRLSADVAGAKCPCGCGGI